MRESLKVVGTLQFFDKEGKLVREEKNLVVNTGLNVIAERLAGVVKNPVSHMGVGTGTTAPSATDIGLEIPKSIRLVASSVVVTAGQVAITATFAGTTYAASITEAALFNALNLGEMISRATFAPYVLGSSDALTIVWTITFANV